MANSGDGWSMTTDLLHTSFCRRKMPPRTLCRTNCNRQGCFEVGWLELFLIPEQKVYFSQMWPLGCPNTPEGDPRPIQHFPLRATGLSLSLSLGTHSKDGKRAQFRECGWILLSHSKRKAVQAHLLYAGSQQSLAGSCGGSRGCMPRDHAPAWQILHVE